jgi:hypothetical protein
MSTRLLRAIARAAVAASLVLAVGGCVDRPGPTESRLAGRVSREQVTPSPIVTVTDGGKSVEFWPFTGNDFSGTPEDPINLVFFGQADPRALRAALLLLDGDRSGIGLPDVAPFNCTWHDVPEGTVQTTFGSDAGWTAGVIQLACGEYAVRFHLRLFDLADGTLGGAHFEVQIPGTPDHQVLSWEFAEAIVAFDFSRTELLGAFSQSGAINAPPPSRVIPAVIYNGLLADQNGSQLLGLLQYPLTEQSADFPIPNDGEATVLTLASSVPGEPLVAQQRFELEFNQTIPKPICTGATPFDLLQVEGPLTFTQHVVLAPSGNYLSTFELRGHLDLTLIDGSTGQSVGSPYQAEINEQHHAILTDNVTLAASFNMQIEIPSAGPFRGSIVTRVSVGPGNASFSELTVRCGN